MKTITPPRRKRDRHAPPETTPCRSCGVSVKHPDPARAESVELWTAQPLSVANLGIPRTPIDLAVTRCDECAERRALAEHLLTEHPRVRRAHGQVAIDRVDAALAALDVGGFRGRITESFTATDAALFDTIENLAGLGGAASWSHDPRREGNARRWDHVPTDLRQKIVDEIRATVHRRAELPMPFVPPGAATGTLRGCLLCGRGTLNVKESEAFDAWGHEYRVESVALGGRARPESITGHLCPACRDAVDRAGVPGMPAVQRAVLAHLGYELRVGYKLSMTTIRGWAALPVGTEPNAKPWQHLDLERLARTFKRWESNGSLRKLAA